MCVSYVSSLDSYLLEVSYFYHRLFYLSILTDYQNCKNATINYVCKQSLATKFLPHSQRLDKSSNVVDFVKLLYNLLLCMLEYMMVYSTVNFRFHT